MSMRIVVGRSLKGLRQIGQEKSGGGWEGSCSSIVDMGENIVVF